MALTALASLRGPEPRRIRPDMAAAYMGESSLTTSAQARPDVV